MAIIFLSAWIFLPCGWSFILRGSCQCPVLSGAWQGYLVPDIDAQCLVVPSSQQRCLVPSGVKCPVVTGALCLLSGRNAQCPLVPGAQ